MNVISMITFKSNLLIAIMHVSTLTYTDIHTDTSDKIIYYIPFHGNY